MMTKKEKMLDLKARMVKNVRENILPFWCDNMVDEENGGFYGKVNKDHTPDKEYPKAIVLNTRMLWAFTMAYEKFGDEKYKVLAKRAFEYIRDHFWDKEYGGTFWMLTYKGIPSEVVKRTYGQAFIIYSMAEYYKAFGDKEALDMAMTTFKLVQDHVKFDNGGYADSVARDWRFDPWVITWMMNRDGAMKLLNSHLHLFEATMTLLDVTGDEYVKGVLKDFLEFLLDVAVEKETHHLKAGMDQDGNRIDGEINYGHDSECCYLMTWSARLIGDPDLIKRADAAALDIMDHVLAEGIDPVNGGMYSDIDIRTGHKNRAKVWWNQCEGITSFFNCYQLTGDEKYLDAAISIWDYTEKNVVDPTGEWFARGFNAVMDEEWKKEEDSTAAFMGTEKASKAKCPYHNSRTCFEIMKRVDEELAKMG